MAFENSIVTGFKRRQKNINEVENKSQRLRNERKIAESKQFEDYALFLKEELGRYFQQYREILIRHGMIPVPRVGVPYLTEKELQISDEYNSTHRRLTWRRGVRFHIQDDSKFQYSQATTIEKEYLHTTMVH